MSTDRVGDGNSAGTGQQQPDHGVIASNSLHKLPTFWSNMPDMWFIQVEQIFAMNRITSDASKYRHVVAVLPQETMRTMSDLLRNPPQTDMYITLKEALIARHSLSENKRLEELLSASEIGDRSPSALFRDMESIMGSSNIVNPDLLKRLWLRKLPEQVKIQVTSSNFEEMPMLLTLADKVWEVIHTLSVSTIASKPSGSSSNREDKLIEALNALTMKVSALEKNLAEKRGNYNRYQRGRRRSWSRSRSRSRSRSKAKGCESHCWYHIEFGDKAHKCIQPCSYNNDKKTDDLKE